MSVPRHIKFTLCVRLQKYLKETICVRSDIYSHLSQKMTIVIVMAEDISTTVVDGKWKIEHHLLEVS